MDEMPDGTTTLMNPVLRGCCTYESLVAGTLTLVDIKRMNDAIAIDAENTRRVHEAMNRNA
jgi:hypothetical protein